MKRIHAQSQWLMLVMLAVCLTGLGTAVFGAETVQSPDGKIKVELELKDGKPFWNVRYGSNTIIQNGLLGVELSADNLSGSYTLAGTERATANTTWKPVWGFISEVRDNYNELTVKVQETAGAKRLMHIVFRAYNEGVGVRYAFPEQPGMKDVTIKRFLTEFTFGGDPLIYTARDFQYGNTTISKMKKSEGAVTVDAGNGNFVSLTDADRADFSVVSWSGKKDVPGVLTASLHSPSSGKLPFKTSWLAMVIGETAGKLIENRYLVENLNPPCAIADTSWIKPGKAICQVYNARMVTDEIKKLMDFGSAHNFDYLEIDHSWSGAETKWTPEEIANFEKNMSPFWKDHPEWRDNVKGDLMKAAKGYVPFRPVSYNGGNLVDLDIPALTAYGMSLKRPIGLCLYVRGALLKEFGGEHAINDVFSCYEKWGLQGVKPGFVPPSSQENERNIAYMVKSAAEHKLIAVIHDAFLPYGLCRTYPNLVNVEGLGGEEAEPSTPPEIKSLHDIMLPFTRGIMGSLDYTPQIYKNSKTHCHQVAMSCVFLGRTSVRAGMKQWSPGGEGGAEIEFMEKMPGLTDEIKVTTDLGKYVTLARRKGDTWYVASMAGPKAQAYDLPLSFLTKGTSYKASIYFDTPGERKASHKSETVSSATVLPIKMEPNGGHLMILETNK
jgi:alpha-glucosidase